MSYIIKKPKLFIAITIFFKLVVNLVCYICSFYTHSWYWILLCKALLYNMSYWSHHVSLSFSKSSFLSPTSDRCILKIQRFLRFIVLGAKCAVSFFINCVYILVHKKVCAFSNGQFCFQDIFLIFNISVDLFFPFILT